MQLMLLAQKQNVYMWQMQQVWTENRLLSN